MKGQAEVFARFLDSLPAGDRDRLAPFLAGLTTLQARNLEMVLLARLFTPVELAGIMLRRAGCDVEV